MANEAQLAILKQGVDAWNKWRRSIPDTINIDLTEAALNGANLFEADLSSVSLIQAKLHLANLERADLRNAILFDADLSQACLFGADLSGAQLSNVNFKMAYLFGADLLNADLALGDLEGANLCEARLSHANLIGANFREADLRGAFLQGTELEQTNLHGANLSHAHFANTKFIDVDLSTVKGIEDVDHQAPSPISIGSIIKSKGIIPDVFLRGAGVPENFIAFARTFTSQENNFDFYSCFISYSSKDQEFAERIYADLQNKGVRCWFAPEDLKIGDKFRTRIDEAIRVYDKLLLVLSQDSIQSDWVEKEVETAFEKERQQKRTMLFPVRIDDTALSSPQAWAADIRRTRHIGDMTKWKDHDEYQRAFARLLRDLKAEG